MKHSIKITALLLLFFIITQILGIVLLALEVDVNTISYPTTSIGDRPEFTTTYGPLAYLLVGVAFGTVALLGIMRLSRAKTIWKYWYLLAVILSITTALGVLMPSILALTIALLLGYMKITRHNFYLHNFTEVLMYSGLGVLFAPLFSVTWAAVLLVIISLYDMYAVWHSKHMAKLATFTRDSQLFAGIMVNYDTRTKQVVTATERKALSTKPKHVTSALLGGGDVLFALLFSGAVFSEFLVFRSITLAMFAAFTTAIGAAIALYLLFYLAKKDVFYPAMPFVSLGCFIAYLLLRIVVLVG